MWQLTPGSHVLGRSSEADIPIDDRLASRKHAEFDVSDGGVRVRDLGSRNGVVLNGRPIEPEIWMPVDDTDHVTIGSTRFVLFKKRRRGHDTIDDRPARRRVKQTASFRAVTASSANYETFLAEAGRAAAREDHDRLESATDLLLDTLTASLTQGMPPDVPAVTSAIQHALLLAEVRGPSAPWLTRIYRVAAAGRVPLSIAALQRIERLIDAPSLESRVALEDYVRVVRSELEDSARGRALVTQLDRLRRISSMAPPAG